MNFRPYDTLWSDISRSATFLAYDSLRSVKYKSGCAWAHCWHWAAECTRLWIQCGPIHKIGWESKASRENLYILQKHKTTSTQKFCHWSVITDQVTRAYLLRVYMQKWQQKWHYLLFFRNVQNNCWSRIIMIVDDISSRSGLAELAHHSYTCHF